MAGGRALAGRAQTPELRAQPFPAPWRAILQQRVPYVRRLPADLQLQLKQHMQVFLAEKVFIGCNGLEITDEIRVTIAAHACLLILNRPSGYYPNLRQILVYPDSFVVQRDRVDHIGLAHRSREVLAGESWSAGAGHFVVAGHTRRRGGGGRRAKRGHS